jgi:hypothetical protein
VASCYVLWGGRRKEERVRAIIVLREQN